MQFQVSSHYPPPFKGVDCEGDRLQEVKVALGGDPDLADDVNGAEANSSFPHGGRPSQCEPAGTVEVLRGGHRFRRRHPKVAAGGDCSAN